MLISTNIKRQSLYLFADMSFVKAELSMQQGSRDLCMFSNFKCDSQDSRLMLLL